MNNYENITWEEFYKVLEQYRDKFLYGSPAEEKYYLEVFKVIHNLNIADKIKYVDSMLYFLNHWKCRFSKKTSPQALANWIKNNVNKLDKLVSFSIENIELPATSEDIDNIYDSLINLKYVGIHNMSDACASKFLHLMIPELFVMWDKNIKPYRNYKYSDFLLKMQQFAKNIKEEFLNKYPGKKIDDYLMESLGYSVKKPLAKYIDEYNWYRAFGYSRIQYH